MTGVQTCALPISGERNPDSFDLWSLGRDGKPGGLEEDSDIGNWATEKTE